MVAYCFKVQVLAIVKIDDEAYKVFPNLIVVSLVCYDFFVFWGNETWWSLLERLPGTNLQYEHDYMSTTFFILII